MQIRQNLSSFYCKKTLVCKDKIYCVTRSQGSLTTKVTSLAFDLSVQEAIKCYTFAKEHYNKQDLSDLNMNGGVYVYRAFKRNLGWKKVLQSIVLFKRNKVPLLSKQMYNPIYLIKEVLFNNALIEREKLYYEYGSNVIEGTNDR